MGEAMDTTKKRSWCLPCINEGAGTKGSKRFQNFVRMNKEDFEELLHRVSPLIKPVPRENYTCTSVYLQYNLINLFHDWFICSVLTERRGKVLNARCLQSDFISVICFPNSQVCFNSNGKTDPVNRSLSTINLNL